VGKAFRVPTRPIPRVLIASPAVEVDRLPSTKTPQNDEDESADGLRAAYRRKPDLHDAASRYAPASIPGVEFCCFNDRYGLGNGPTRVPTAEEDANDD